LLETGFRDYSYQIGHAASPSVKARRWTLAFLLALEISNDQAAPRFEHSGDFSQSLTFKASR
jgi:hypothetical protein